VRLGEVQHRPHELLGGLQLREVAGPGQRDLAVVVSAGALFTLTDLCALSPEDAIASTVHTARALTQAAAKKPFRRCAGLMR
jgi:hypothetical protein